MSQSFRPVKEIWNTHSSCFVQSEELVALLPDLAARVGTASDEHEYGDNKAVWLEDGYRVLNYIETDERFTAASFTDSLEEQGVVIHKIDLTTLVGNMRGLAKQWRNSIGEQGELVTSTLAETKRASGPRRIHKPRSPNPGWSSGRRPSGQ
jgi:hypothetical protein